MDTESLIALLHQASDEFARELVGLRSEQDIRAAQAHVLGKKGKITEVMKSLAGLPPEGKRTLGAAVNAAKQAIETAVATRLADLANAALAEDLARSVDVTLPARGATMGHRHLLSQVQDECVDIFAALGFTVATGPQIETDFNNFEALAMPAEHPARDMQDTFYVDDGIVLRTHTSPVQIRTMMTQSPPIRIIAPGQVYRRDDDATHSPMFTQIEGLLVDTQVRFSDLKGVLLHFVRRFFMRDLLIRFRPSYFPFVEPGAEVDMECTFCDAQGRGGCRICKATGWLEIGGAGMVDPDVFQKVGYDPELVSGFAFGMGIERMAMLRHNVTDIKHYYEGDLRFLRQF